MNTIEFTKKINVTNEDINDIMSTAFYGGITYWCREVEIVGNLLGEYTNEHISRGGTLILHDAESEDKWELNKEKLLNGIKQAAEENIYPDYEWISQDGLDPCMIDAEVADCIVQYALFNEIVYG